MNGYAIFRVPRNRGTLKRVGYVVASTEAQALKQFAGTRDHELRSLPGDIYGSGRKGLVINGTEFHAHRQAPSDGEWRKILGSLSRPSRVLVVDEKGVRT
jgi:hypothetical protein